MRDKWEERRGSWSGKREVPIKTGEVGEGGGEEGFVKGGIIEVTESVVTGRREGDVLELA